MRWTGVLGLVALVAAGCGGGSNGGATTAEPLVISGAWARTTPPAAENGVVYLSVTSRSVDALLSAAVPATVAGGTELHETMGAGGEGAMANMPNMKSADGTMTMVPLAQVPLPAGTPVRFEPGGKHIMLTKLAAPLTAGATFTLSLTFAEAGARDVTVTVRDNPP